MSLFVTFTSNGNPVDAFVGGVARPDGPLGKLYCLRTSDYSDFLLYITEASARQNGTFAVLGHAPAEDEHVKFVLSDHPYIEHKGHVMRIDRDCMRKVFDMFCMDNPWVARTISHFREQQ